MNPLLKEIYKNRFFHLICFAISLVCFFTVEFYSFQNIIPVKNDFLLKIMINLTFMGDAFFSVLLILFLASYFNQRKLSVKVFAGFVITMLLVQAVKNFFHPDTETQLFFENSIYLKSDLNIINNRLSQNSISSHAALSFMLAGIFYMHNKLKLRKSIYFLIAIGVGLSRIYLEHESINAVSFGSIVGLIGASAVYVIKANILHVMKYKNKIFKLRNNITKKQPLTA